MQIIVACLNFETVANIDTNVTFTMLSSCLYTFLYTEVVNGDDILPDKCVHTLTTCTSRPITCSSNMHPHFCNEERDTSSPCNKSRTSNENVFYQQNLQHSKSTENTINNPPMKKLETKRVVALPQIGTDTRSTHYSYQVKGDKYARTPHSYFTIDEVLGFHEFVDSRDAYESALRKVMQSVMSGFNRTVFVEGNPPGFGSNIPIDVLNKFSGSAVNVDVAWELFSIAMERPYQEFCVSATLVEIVAGEVRDLLSDNDNSFKDPASMICNDLSSLLSLLVTGEKNRSVESQAPNGGHIVFRLMFKNNKTQMSPDKELRSTESALNLVFLNTGSDLSGDDYEQFDMGDISHR